MWSFYLLANNSELTFSKRGVCYKWMAWIDIPQRSGDLICMFGDTLPYVSVFSGHRWAEALWAPACNTNVLKEVHNYRIVWSSLLCTLNHHPA